MKQKTSRWELLLMVGFMVILLVGLWGTSGSGLRFGSQVLAAGMPQVTTGGGSEPGTIVAPGTGTWKVMPAVSGTGANGQITFWTGTDTLSGDNGFYWDNTNKRLGIGTASPLRKLHYYGDAALFQRDVDAAGFIIQRTDTNRWVFGASENPSLGTGFSIYTYPVGAGSATPRLFLDLDGRVGIGTTSPDSLSRLHVVNSAEVGGGRAVYGETTAASGDTYGVYGKNSNVGNWGALGHRYYGVQGNNVNNNYGYLGGSDYGVYGYYNSNGNNGCLGSNGCGVIGNSTDSKGVCGNSTNSYGVVGDSTNDVGVKGQNGTSGNFGWLGSGGSGVYGYHDDSDNFGRLGTSDYGVYGEVISGTSDYGVYGKHSGYNNYGYLGGDTCGVSGQYGSGGPHGSLGMSDKGVYGYSSLGNGVYGDSSSGNGVYGNSSTGYGVKGTHTDNSNYGYLGCDNYGAYGEATWAINYGVYGKHLNSLNYGYLGGNGYGVYGYHDGSDNYGYLGGNDYGVYGNSSNGHAGYFEGKVKVAGSLATAYCLQTGSYTATATDSVIAVDLSSASNNATITLPTADGIAGRVYTIKLVDDKGGTYDVNVVGTSPDEIDGQTTGYKLYDQWDYVTVVSDGDNWLIMGTGP